MKPKVKLGLTKEQRLIVYKKALSLMKSDLRPAGFCYYLSRASQVLGHVNHTHVAYDHMWINFPEVWAERPCKYKHLTYWFEYNFEGNNKRIAILEKVIEEMSK